MTTSDVDEYQPVQEELLLQTIDLVAAHGTGFAFPSQTLYLADDGGPAAPARLRAIGRDQEADA